MYVIRDRCPFCLLLCTSLTSECLNRPLQEPPPHLETALRVAEAASGLHLIVNRSTELSRIIEGVQDSISRVAARVPPSLHSFSSAECRAAGHTAGLLKLVGFTAAELNGNYSASELTAVGFDLNALKAVGFDATSLKAAGFEAPALKAAGFDAAALKSAGFDATELKAAMFDIGTLKAAGFDLDDLRAAGFDATILGAAAFDLVSLKAAGFTNGQLWDAGWRCNNGHTRDNTENHCRTCTNSQCCPNSPFRR